MPEATLNQDIEFQPKTQGYSFSRLPDEKRKSKIKTNIFITLFLVLPLLLILLILSLTVLNYFGIISLSTISPIFNNLPKSQTVIQTAKQEIKPNNIAGTNQYELEGTLEKYDQNFIYIKLYRKIITIEYIPNSQFYFTKTITNNKTATPASETITTIDFPSNILSKENIGKKVSVQYIIENNQNTLQTLTLNK